LILGSDLLSAPLRLSAAILSLLHVGFGGALFHHQFSILLTGAGGLGDVRLITEMLG
jgi:hypothetical protein